MEMEKLWRRNNLIEGRPFGINRRRPGRRTELVYTISFGPFKFIFLYTTYNVYKVLKKRILQTEIWIRTEIVSLKDGLF